MRPDSDIERDVKDELQWRPDLDATDIAVSVKNGVVTLTGFVHSYVDKYEAEAAAKCVAGVVGVANDIEVRLRNVDANGLRSPLAQNLLGPVLPIRRAHADPQDETVCNRITLELLGLLPFEEADDHRRADPAGRSDAYGDNGRPYPGATRRKNGECCDRGADVDEDARDTCDRKRNVLTRHEGPPRRVRHIGEVFGGNVRCAQLLPYRIGIGQDVDVRSVEPRQPQSLSRRFERLA